MSITRLEIPMTKGKKSCLIGYLSWERLEKVLRSSKEIGDMEVITHFEVKDEGIQFGIQKKHYDVK
jgi:hypothetical protein